MLFILAMPCSAEFSCRQPIDVLTCCCDSSAQCGDEANCEVSSCSLETPNWAKKISVIANFIEIHALTVFPPVEIGIIYVVPDCRAPRDVPCFSDDLEYPPPPLFVGHVLSPLPPPVL